MFASLKEAFTDGGPQTMQDLPKLFTQQLTSPVLLRNERDRQILRGTGDALNVANVVTRQPYQDNNLYDQGASMNLSDQNIKNQEMCKTTDLDSLMQSVDPYAPVRCGWIYEKGDAGVPKMSKGYLGLEAGPLTKIFKEPDLKPSQKWFWNLEDAKKAILTDNCRTLVTCEQAGTGQYQNVCAYDKTKGYGIPVSKSGDPLYPEDPFFGGLRKNLIYNGGQCPKPEELARLRGGTATAADADGGAGEFVTVGGFQINKTLCTPDDKGQLPKNCILNLITSVGCSDNGALYQALSRQSKPGDFGAGLKTRNAYKLYQERSFDPINNDLITQGKIDVNTALKNIRNINNYAGKNEMRGEVFAARDLCLKEGALDKFDFCLEYNDNTKGPYRLDCLQREFRRQGGQTTGSEYPTEQKLPLYNSLDNWGAVRREIAKLRGKMYTNSYDVQKEGLLQFLGIQRDKVAFQQIEYMNGVEVFWYDRRDGTFIGRRVPQTRFIAPFIHWQGGDVDDTGLSDLVQFQMIANIRPSADSVVRFYLETDDRSRFAINNEKINDPPFVFSYDTPSEMNRWYDQAPTLHRDNMCKALQKDGPNYFMAFWQEAYGVADFKIFATQCVGENFKGNGSLVPPSWWSLTQEPDAPMLSFAAQPFSGGASVFTDYRLVSMFYINWNKNMQVIKQKIDSIPGIMGYLPITQGTTGFINRRIRHTAVRTITFVFSMDELPFKGSWKQLFYFGELSVGISFAGNQPKIYVSGFAGGRVHEFDVQIEVGKIYHLTVMYSSPNRSSPPSKVIAQLVDITKAKSVSFPSGGVNSTVIDKGSNLFNKTDKNYFVIGSQANPANTASYKLYSVNFFDYEFSSRHYLRDTQNIWARAWIDRTIA